jgi:hypothetical protein
VDLLTGEVLAGFGVRLPGPGEDTLFLHQEPRLLDAPAFVRAARKSPKDAASPMTDQILGAESRTTYGTGAGLPGLVVTA